MPLNISKKYMLIPIIYVFIIILLIYMQLSATTRFSEYYSFMEISGEKRSNAKDYNSNLFSLDINSFGLVFNFSRTKKPEIITADNNRTELSLQGFKDIPGGIEILFSGNIRFKVFISENTGFINREFLRIEPLLPYTEGAVKEVSIPFTILKPGILNPASIFPAAGFAYSGKNYFLTAGSSSIIDYDAGRIRIRPDRSGQFYASVSESDINYKDPFSFWFTQRISPVISNHERDMEKEYIDSAYKSWRIDRFDRETGKWLDKNGSRFYSKEIISSLASELFRRNEFSANQWIYRLSSARNSDTISFESGLISGSTISAFTSFMAEDVKLLSEISEKIKTNNTDVFKIPDIVSVITDRGPYSLLQELMQLADNQKISNLEAETAAGLANIYLDYAAINPEDKNAPVRLNYIINEIILPGIIIADKDLFIAFDEYADTLFTLKISQLLKKASASADRDFLYSIGDKLVYSLLQYKDSNGFLPEKIRISKSGIINKEGAVEQEQIYPYLAAARYMPQIRSLKNILAPGAWIATCAGEVTAEKLPPGSLKIETLLPAGNTEYIIIQGIPAVSGINLYNTNWVSDPQYESYRAGWVYVSETQTLFIKILHNSDTETIIINF